MHRRSLLGQALMCCVPLGVGAQAPRSGRPLRVAFATSLSPERRQIVEEALSARGWKPGVDLLLVDTGVPYGPRIEEAAQRAVGLRADVILVLGSAYAAAVRRLTGSTPIVMISSGYPVAAGLAESLARPGGNVTGNTSYAGTGVWGKQFQLLKELKPGLRRVGMLWDYAPPALLKEEVDFGLEELRRDAQSLGLTLQFAEVRQAGQGLDAMTELQRHKVEAVFITAGPLIYPDRARLTEVALAGRLPTLSDIRWSPLPASGPLMSYGVVSADLWRQAAGFVDRILRGASAAELPILQPARFELVIHRRVARSMGLSVPQSLLLRADELID